MLGGLQPPTVRPYSHFSFSFSPFMALCNPFPCHCDHDRDPCPQQLVVLMAGVLLWLSLLHPCDHCQPLRLLAGCPACHQVCEMSTCSVELRQFLCLLSYRPLHAAPLVAGGHQGLTPPSPFSVLVSLCRLKYGCTRSLCGILCGHHHNLHCHIHRRVVLPSSSFSRVQVTPPAHSEIDHHFCEASLVVLVVAFSAKPLREPTPLCGFLCATSSCGLVVAGTLAPGSIRRLESIAAVRFLIAIVVLGLSRCFCFAKSFVSVP